MKLIDAEKISNYIKSEINPYGKPFEGTVYEFGLKLMKYLENASVDYDVDEVVERLETYSNKDEAERLGTIPIVELEDAFKIVKGGGIYE